MNAPAVHTNTPSIFDIMNSKNAGAELERIAGGSIDPSRFAMIATTSIKSKWDDLKNCDPFTIFTAVLEAAQLDLNTSVAANEFYFVPMGKSCVGMLGYRGMLRLAYRTKAVEKIDAKLRYAGDDFEFVDDQDGPRWKHTPYWQTGKDKGQVLFAYAHAKLPNREIIFKVADMDRLKTAESVSKSKHTWKQHREAMQVKTGIRVLWTWIPKDKIDRRVAEAFDDDAQREIVGVTDARVGADWTRGEFNLPPESMSELSAAPGLEPDAEAAP